MARIVEYDAPNTKLTESTQGLQAWETAGRRIGPLLNSAAQDIRQEGKLAGQEIKDTRWPLDFLAMAKAPPPQISFRVVGGVNNLQNSIDQLNNLSAVSIGAANIGDVADEAMAEEAPSPEKRKELANQQPYALLKGGAAGANPNAQAYARANAWYFGKAQPVTQGATNGGLPYTPDNSGGVYPGVVGRAAAAIGEALGNGARAFAGDNGDASTDTYGGPN